MLRASLILAIFDKNGVMFFSEILIVACPNYHNTEPNMLGEMNSERLVIVILKARNFQVIWKVSNFLKKSRRDSSQFSNYQ